LILEAARNTRRISRCTREISVIGNAPSYKNNPDCYLAMKDIILYHKGMLCLLSSQHF
jgi:hypothetical protein